MYLVFENTAMTELENTNPQQNPQIPQNQPQVAAAANAAENTATSTPSAGGQSVASQTTTPQQAAQNNQIPVQNPGQQGQVAAQGQQGTNPQKPIIRTSMQKRGRKISPRVFAI